MTERDWESRSSPLGLVISGPHAPPRPEKRGFSGSPPHAVLASFADFDRASRRLI
jgi:hypothetical protein